MQNHPLHLAQREQYPIIPYRATPMAVTTLMATMSSDLDPVFWTVWATLLFSDDINDINPV
jgi:hypothetical protein